MRVRAPGTIIQHLFVRERLARCPVGRFVEIGAGQGDLTSLLLAEGWRGTAIEAAPASAGCLCERFAAEMAKGHLAVISAEFAQAELPPGTADLVISSMVLEHLPAEAEAALFTAARRWLAPGGQMIGLVPAGARYWGIEDDIAGHVRRYDRSMITGLAARCGWRIRYSAGLTFPISNWLLPLSNRLVRRAESPRLNQHMAERTRASGMRAVWFKTRFPAIFAVLLNSWTMRPLHLLQKCFVDSDRALVLYFEAVPA